MIAHDVAAAIAAGQVPDDYTGEYLSQDKTRKYTIATLCVAILTFIVVITRALSRLFILRRFGLDDVLALLSLLLVPPFVVLSILLMRAGAGRHYAYVLYVQPRSLVRLCETLDFILQIVYMTCLLLCRLSGLAFYHRVVGVHPAFLRAVRAFACVVAAGYIVQMCLLIFHCRPVTSLFPYEWEDNFDKYTCMDWGIVHVGGSSISLFCDLLLFSIPIAILSILTMSWKRKIQLVGILLPGVLVIVVSIGRVVLVIRNQWDDDQSWLYDPLLITQMSEMGGVLIAISIPGIKPLWDRLFSKNQELSGSEGSEGGIAKIRRASTGLGLPHDMRLVEEHEPSHEMAGMVSEQGLVSGTTYNSKTRESCDTPRAHGGRDKEVAHIV